MRRVLVILAAFGVLAAACSKNGPDTSGETSAATSEATTPPTTTATSGVTTAPTSGTTSTTAPTTAASAADCAADAPLHTEGQLTLATDNPAFQPWFAGAKGEGEGPWEANPNFGQGNPYTDKGYEDIVAYDVAELMGFSKDQVVWVPIPFAQSFRPGPKDFDIYIGQVSFSEQRAEVVDFSDSYYDVQQALVAHKGTPLASAKTFADLKDANLGVQVGTTSFDYIVDNIQPNHEPMVYDNSNDVIAAFNANQIDGYLVDAPDAYVNVLIGQVNDGVVAGQFPTIGEQEHYGLVLPKDSALTACTNIAIASLRADGTLDGLEEELLSDVTFPEISQG